jgi:hypothetical protein
MTLIAMENQGDELIDNPENMGSRYSKRRVASSYPRRRISGICILKRAVSSWSLSANS